MDRLFCMQVFARVVEHGSFTKAADSLGIARATATAAISQLEDRLGVRLLNRTTRRLSITDEGQSYYANCVRILGDIAEAEDGLSGARLAPRGRLRVSIPQSFVSMTFFPALTRFTQCYPELEVEIVLTDRAVNLIEEGIDCAIRGLEIPEDSGLVARKLSAVRWLTCASPEYFAKYGTPNQIQDLGGHNCIRFISPSTGRPRDWLFEVDGNVTVIVPNGKLRLTSFDAVTQTAIAGCGIAQIPDALTYTAVMAGQLQPILMEFAAEAPPLMLVYPGNRYLTAKVRAFMEFFADTFRKEGWWPEIAAKSGGANKRKAGT